MKVKSYIYIGLFAILYLVVAFVSLIHAVSFFGLANVNWMAIMLSIAFELGQAAVLFSILTSSKDRKRFMPWVLMCILTAVQVLGNVYSSYKHIVTYSPENLRYFKEPIFIWTSLPDNVATVIITYIVGAILPITALLLTSMVANYIEDISNNGDKNEKTEETHEEVVPEDNVEEAKELLTDDIVEDNMTNSEENKEEIFEETKEETKEPKKSHFINL